MVAGRYTLLDQSALDELLPLCAERGVAMLAGGGFNSGILSSPVAEASYDCAPATPPVVQRAERVAAVCRRHGVPLKAAALQFPLAHPAVAAILSGCQRPAELEENLRLLHTHLPAALWQDLSAEGLLRQDSRVPSN